MYSSAPGCSRSARAASREGARTVRRVWRRGSIVRCRARSRRTRPARGSAGRGTDPSGGTQVARSSSAPRRRLVVGEPHRHARAPHRRLEVAIAALAAPRRRTRRSSRASRRSRRRSAARTAGTASPSSASQLLPGHAAKQRDALLEELAAFARSPPKYVAAPRAPAITPPTYGSRRVGADLERAIEQLRRRA